MIKGKCVIFGNEEPATPIHEWSQQFCALPHIGDFIQGPEPVQRGCIVAVTHCEDENGAFIGVVVD